MTTTTVPPGVRTVPPRRPSLATRCDVWGSPLDPCLPPHPREPGQWYVLRVAAQAEFVVAHLLRRRGVIAWAPCLTKWVQADRHHRRSKKAVRRPLLPGYVFVKLAANVWPRLFDTTGVLGVLTFWGRPWPLRPADISRLRHMSSRLQAREAHRLMPTNRAFEVGDEVEVAAGPFEGMTLRVYEITAGHARGLVSIFGRETEVQFTVDHLGAVA